MKTLIQKFAITLAFISGLFFSNQCLAQVDFIYDEAGYFDNPLLWMDQSHDLVRLTKDGNDLEIEVFMFDANEFDSIPNTLDFDLLQDLATEHERFDIDLDDIEESYFGGIVIALEGGDDVLYTDPDLEINVAVFGGDGDDFIQGGSGNDFLFGGRGSDSIFGFGGNDRLEGGNDEFGVVDNERDYLWGGPGADTFVQIKIKVMSTLRVNGLRSWGTTPTATQVWTQYSQDRIFDFQSWSDSIIYF